MRTRTMALCVLAAVFVSGVIVGVAAAGSRRDPGAALRVARRPGVESDLALLGLSNEQRRRIDAHIAAARPQSEAELSRLVVRLQAIADSLDRRIRAELTSAQRATLDSLVRARGGRGPSVVIKRAPDPSPTPPETLPARPFP